MHFDDGGVMDGGRTLGVMVLLVFSACSPPWAQGGSSSSSGSSSGAGADAGVEPGDASVGPLVISQVAGQGFESETHVVVRPDGKVLTGWIGIRGAGVENGYALSSDLGRTWSPPTRTDGTPTLGDPVLTVGMDGSIYYGFLDGTCGAGGCSGGHVWIARMGPTQSTFATPVDVSPADAAEFYDKPWLMTGVDGSLIAIFAGRKGDYPNNTDRIIVARSVDQGNTWPLTYAVPTLPMGHLAGIPHACVSRVAHRMWIAHVDLDTAIGASIRWSDDLGVTWLAADSSSGFAPASEAGGLQSFDLRCTGEGDDVWVMHGVAAGASSSEGIPPMHEVHVSHSINGGRTWTHAVALKNVGEKYLRPEILLEPSGALDIVAYVGAAEGDPQGAVRWWRSVDGGDTFEERGTLVSPIRFTGSRAGSDWIGDYSGLALEGGNLFATVVDNSSGTSHVTFVRWPAE